MTDPKATFAAIDLGTNNCRMLVARPHGLGFRVIDAFSRVTRLGEGLATEGRLRESAMLRTIAALRMCASKIQRNNVSRVRLVATEACRRAINNEEFARRVYSETGLHLEIISADEESRLALTGCTSLMDPDKPYGLMFDIGGGSTELVWVEMHGHKARMQGVQSLQLGVVTLAEEMGDELNNAEVFEETVCRIMSGLGQFGEIYDVQSKLEQGLVQMLGTSGTVTTLAALHLGLEKYDRNRVDGTLLRLCDVRSVIKTLLSMSPQARADNACIGPERADLVIAGCVILEAVCRLWPTSAVRVADRGVREGILIAMMGQQQPRQMAGDLS